MVYQVREPNPIDGRLNSVVAEYRCSKLAHAHRRRLQRERDSLSVTPFPLVRVAVFVVTRPFSADEASR